MKISKVSFVKSFALGTPLNEFDLPEIAVAGKSNVGKSSFINFLTGARIAKTSKEPGRTRLINYFSVNGGQFHLVDLPGYGYAEVSDSEKEKWGKLMDEYFRTGKHIKNVFILIDIRRIPSSDDLQMADYLLYYHIPYTIICTKCDKVSKAEAQRCKKTIANAFKIGVDSLLVTSSEKQIGKEEVLQKIENILNV